MAFRVEVAPQALADLDATASYIRKESGNAAAENWFNGMIDAIASAAEDATAVRCGA